MWAAYRLAVGWQQALRGLRRKVDAVPEMHRSMAAWGSGLRSMRSTSGEFGAA
jgi:hypothetical protein